MWLCEYNKLKCSKIIYELKVTDPIVVDKIRKGQNISRKCLLTISMATPYKSQSYDKEYCWKMIAGVVEL